MTNNPTIDGVSLLSCPFCGTSPEITKHFRDESYSFMHRCSVLGPISMGFREDPKCHEAVWNTRIESPEVAALQSTIAQLDARVAQLESGMGEPGAFALHPVGDYGRKQVFFAEATGIDEAQEIAGKHFAITPLFTAPPAPVSVVLPKRKQYVGQGVYPDSHDWTCANSEVTGWNARLDATAALNGVRG